MVILLCMLAIAMIVSGLAAMAFGMSIVQVERGWTMVISGSVGASGGAILLGLAIAAQRLGRIAHEMVWIRDRLATIGEMTAETVAWQDQVQDEVAPEEPAPRAPETPATRYAPVVEVPAANYVPAFEPPAAPAPPLPAEPVLVGQYSSGGNEYKMYSDGSIDAMTPAGLRRFSSLEELRAFVAGGGERAQ